MLFFQILATIFIVFSINRIVERYQRAFLPKAEMLVWLGFWLLVSLAVWWPRGTDVIAQLLGVSRGADVIFAASIAMIFYLLFSLFSQVHRLARELTQLVRALAITNGKTPHEPPTITGADKTNPKS